MCLCMNYDLHKKQKKIRKKHASGACFLLGGEIICFFSLML